MNLPSQIYFKTPAIQTPRQYTKFSQNPTFGLCFGFGQKAIGNAMSWNMIYRPVPVREVLITGPQKGKDRKGGSHLETVM